MKQEVLGKALEAFWTEIARNHPERESGNLAPGTAYDLERWAQHAYEAWLEVNKPVYYVQRTTVMVVEITGVGTPEEAVAEAKKLEEPDWFEMAIDIEHDYIVLDASGKQI